MLERCKGVYGDVEIIPDFPSILAYRNALYVPQGDPNSHAGLFDSGRKAIPAAGYFRGPHLEQLTPHCTPYRYSDFQSHAGEETFLYCGHLHDHFGHFLLSSFSRFWPFVEPEFMKTARIVVHAAIGAADYLSQHTFAYDLFRAIGLYPDNFVTFREPTRIDNILVVAPSFEETSFAHPVYATLGHFAGSSLYADKPACKSLSPVWLSKERLTSGVRRILNEEELTVILRKKGFEIVFPETLPLFEQGALFRDRPFVGAFAGSALHSSILAPGRSIIAISDSEVIMSSYPLMDRINDTNAIYLGVSNEDMLKHEDTSGSFTSLNVIINPSAVAESILHHYEELS